MTAEDSLWSKIGPQVHILVPGSFAGGLLIALAAYCNPGETQTWIKAVGTVLVLPVLIVIGVSIHLFYRIVIGEWLFYPARDAIRWGMDYLYAHFRNTEPGFVSFTTLLGRHRVPFGYRRRTYSAIRGVDGVFNQMERDRFDVLHATYAFFYLAALELAAASIYCKRHSAGDWKLLAALSIITLVCAYVADLRQDIWECRLMRRDTTKLDDFIKTLGF